MSGWPEIPFARWEATGKSLHMWTQIVGKFRLALTPWVNHSWQATFYVTARGLSTSLIPAPPGQPPEKASEVIFDFMTHTLEIQCADGKTVSFFLEPMSVAEFHNRFRKALESVDLRVPMDIRPNEVPEAIPFPAQQETGDYSPAAALDFWRALLAIDGVFKTFRTGFLGKVSPVHLFWGSFDLAVTRFSGRTAPLHPGGFPALPDAITREAYSHEVSSAGFWPGGGGLDFPGFYAYAYPTPEGFSGADPQVAAASFDEQLGEFILPYDAVRQAADPEATLLTFLQATYEAAAHYGAWDRAALEAPLGRPRIPRPIA